MDRSVTGREGAFAGGGWGRRAARVAAAMGALSMCVSLVTGCATGGSGRGSTGSGGADDQIPRPPLSEANQKAAHGSLSAVVVQGQPRVTVMETLESVFTGAGLALASRSNELVVFERPANRRERAAYGSWSGDEARVRFKVEIFQEGTTQFFLVCRCFIARGAGSGVEDEQAYARRHVREYEGLLYEVSARLN